MSFVVLPSPRLLLLATLLAVAPSSRRSAPRVERLRATATAAPLIHARHVYGTPGHVTHVRERLVLSRNAVHELAGPLSVEAGGALVLEPGARVEARPGVSISIEREGALLASGTFLEPVVLTCTSATKYAGCWSGLRMHGYARINHGTADSPAAPAGGGTGCLQSVEASAVYGGCADSDSSGVLQYVRVEYAAGGVQLFGVGSRTRLEQLQVNRSLGDGLTIMGGAVDVRRLYLTANGGYGLAWRGGWRGRGQFIVVQQDAAGHTGGISGSNAGSAPTGFAGTPRSAPTLYNVTVIAPPSLTASVERPALHVRQGTSGTLRNVLVHSSSVVLDLDDNLSCLAFDGQVPITLDHVVLAANATLGSPDTDPAYCELPYTSPDLETQLLADAGTVSTVVSDPAALTALLRNPTNLIVPDLRPSVSGAAATSLIATPPADGFFDVTVSYVGAVDPASPSRNNIPWYAGWTVPAPAPPPPGSASGIVASATRGAFANVVVASAFGVRDTTDVAGSYALTLPAGEHTLSVIGLPIGCSAAPLTVTVTSSGTVTAPITAECTSVEAVEVGALHACLMTGDRKVQCWGQNDYGMVGDGTTATPRLLPVRAAGDLAYDAGTLSAGLTHSCATRTSTAFCWGLNVFGVLGVGTTGFYSVSPVAAGTPQTPTFARTVAGGYHHCGLTPLGDAWCWGWNAEGQVGANLAAFSVPSPTAVSAGATRFASLALGESHSCGLTSDGRTWCWGGNARGESGRDTTGGDLKSLAPALVANAPVFVAIDAGTLHTCGLSADGTAWCWGSREFGQLGDGSVTGMSAQPVAVQTTARFTQIAAGGFTTCGVTVERQVLCWGAGISGVLGNGTNSAVQSTPVMVSGLSDIRRVAVNLAEAAGMTACASSVVGDVFCWGAGTAGQLGNGASVSSNLPVQVKVRGPF